MPKSSDPKSIRQRLLCWYDVEHRNLPWRAEPDIRPEPYHVWLSEIMLQQTTVATVVPYFGEFVTRWPDVCTLAAAPLDDVLHAWQGLGYYARARNLHKCAARVANELGGAFPDTEAALLSMPGVGVYTAAAIAAIAFERPVVPVDGNVERVTARLYGVRHQPLKQSKKRIARLAQGLAADYRPGDFAQAMMDLGATLCRRGTPDCARCPFADVCVAHARGEERRFPESKPRKALPTRTTVMLLLQDREGRVLLEQRPSSGLWGGLWSLPQFDDAPALEAWLDAHAPGSELAPAWAPFTHVFSHFRLEVTPRPARIARLDSIGESRRWYDPARPDALGLAAPVKRLLASLAPFTLEAPPSPRESVSEESP